MKKFEYDDVLMINKIICNREGQSSSVINESNIKSALSVQYSYYDTDEEIRTALFHHLIIAHGFEDGNKRTAVTVLLYDGNVNISDNELEKITLEIASNNGSKYNIKELTNKIFGTNLIIENLHLGEYMKYISEKLNYLDHVGMDNNNYYDLRNLFEAVEPKLTTQDKNELKKLLTVTNDAKTISAFLTSKDDSLSEDIVDDWENEETDFDDIDFDDNSPYKELTEDVLNYIADNKLYPNDVYPTKDGFVIDIAGDWKHEHVRLNLLLKQYFTDNGIIATINTVPTSDDGSDYYEGNHIVRILSINESLQLNESVNENKETILTQLNSLLNLIDTIINKSNYIINLLNEFGDTLNAGFIETDIVLELQETIKPAVNDILDYYEEV